MVDYYSNEEIWIIISVIFIISLIGSTIYFLYYIDCKKTNIVLLIISILYLSLFFFLNIIATFDLVFNNEKGFNNMMNVITKFYSNFNLISNIAGFFLFNIVLYYLESGYFSIYKRSLDYFLRYWKKLKKLELWKKILLLILGAALIGGLLTLYIIYKDYLKLDNGIYVFNALLNSYAVIGIYVNVGFFVVQIIKDCKREKSPTLSYKYYVYSKKKIILETERCVEKIKKKYEDLYENDPLNELNKKKEKNPYCKYLLNIYNDYNKTIQLFDSEDNIEEIKIINDNEQNNKNNTNNINIYTTTKSNTEEGQNLSTKKVTDNKSKKIILEIEDEELNQEFIRKFIKTKRKLYKMQRLYKDIEGDKEELSKKCCCLWFYIKYIILFIVLFFIFISDFLFPFFYDPDDYNSPVFEDSSSSFDKEDSIGELILAVLLSTLCVFFLTSFYTIANIFSITRSTYITGDILSGKNMNDNISLMKTTQLISENAFVLVYCNLYMYKILDSDDKAFGRPKFYDEVIIPDYRITKNVGVFMIVKFILIIIFAILTCCVKKFIFLFKNDLAEYNSKYSKDDFTSVMAKDELDKIIEEKKKYVLFLENKNN